MFGPSRDDIRRGWWMLATGLVLGFLAGVCLPFICLFVIPLLGWVAGGGTTRRSFLFTWSAAMLGVGAIGMTTFLSTFTFGWWPSAPEWIAYVFIGESVFYWGLYLGMRWLHTSSGSAHPDRQ